MIAQLQLPVDQKEWPGRNFLDMADYLGAEGAFILLHQGIGWIWDGRLISKTAENADPDETCHYQLFGNDVYRIRFRGWFNTTKKILIVQDRLGELKSIEDIPSQLLSHLLRKFPVSIGKIRIY